MPTNTTRWHFIEFRSKCLLSSRIFLSSTERNIRRFFERCRSVALGDVCFDDDVLGSVVGEVENGGSEKPRLETAGCCRQAGQFTAELTVCLIYLIELVEFTDAMNM